MRKAYRSIDNSGALEVLTEIENGSDKQINELIHTYDFYAKEVNKQPETLSRRDEIASRVMIGYRGC